MARTTSTNFTGGLDFTVATEGTDLFKKEDVQVAAQALDQHDHTNGKGAPLPAGAFPAGSITSGMIADGTIVAGDIADGAVTSAKIADGTIATADHADASVTNVKLASDTARANLLTNGGFEIWQRGNGPFTTTGAYTADRWSMSIGASDTLSVSKDTVNVATGSNTAAAVTCTRGGVGQTFFRADLKKSDGYQTVGGVTFSGSVRVRTSSANAIQIRCASDGTGASPVLSAFHSGNGTWETLTASITLPADATSLGFMLWFTGSCTAYIDNAMLVIGSVAADYAPLHPADDLARCLRYYETWRTNDFLSTGRAQSTTEIRAPLPFMAIKAVTPTVTFSAASLFAINGSTNPTSITAAGPSIMSTLLVLGGTGYTTGDAMYMSINAGGQINIESNP